MPNGLFQIGKEIQDLAIGIDPDGLDVLAVGVIGAVWAVCLDRASRRSRLIALVRRHGCRGHDNGGSYVLKKFFADACPTIFSLLNLVDPVVDGDVQLDQSFLLLEEAVPVEANGLAFPQVGYHSGVESLPTLAERFVRPPQIFASLVQRVELLGQRVNIATVEDLELFDLAVSFVAQPFSFRVRQCRHSDRCRQTSW